MIVHIYQKYQKSRFRYTTVKLPVKLLRVLLQIMTPCHIIIGFLLLTKHFHFFHSLFSLPSSLLPSLFSPLLPSSFTLPTSLPPYFISLFSFPPFFHKICSESMLCTQPCVNYGVMWKYKQDTPNLP